MRIYQDLFAYDEGGLCHLSVFDTGGEGLVALAAELDDNPGRSVVNAAEALTRRIGEVFDGERPRVFVTFSSRAGEWTEILWASDDKAAGCATRIPHRNVETLLGEEVSLPKSDSWSAVDFVADDHPLLDLIPPEEVLPNPLDEMTVVAVADLPWPHNPSNCAHYQRFERILALYGSDFSSHVPAGAHFFLTLEEEDTGLCRYHANDWKAVAAASVELLDRLPANAETDDVYALASELLPEGDDRSELVFLFLDPIVWEPGSTSITNGQHRACALKAAHTPLCVAAMHGRGPYKPVPADPRRRAQSTLATYWASRLGASELDD